MLKGYNLSEISDMMDQKSEYLMQLCIGTSLDEDRTEFFFLDLRTMTAHKAVLVNNEVISEESSEGDPQFEIYCKCLNEYYKEI